MHISDADANQCHLLTVFFFILNVHDQILVDVLVEVERDNDTSSVHPLTLARAMHGNNNTGYARRSGVSSIHCFFYTFSSTDLYRIEVE